MSTFLLIIGTFLLAAEALGKDRISKWEMLLKKISNEGKELFGKVIVLIAVPWKSTKTRSTDKDLHFIERTPKWIFTGFFIISGLSWILINYLQKEYDETIVTIIIISTWFLLVLLSFPTSLILRKFKFWYKQPRAGLNILFIVGFGLLSLIFGVLTLIAFVLTLLTSFPASAIFVLYICIFIVSWVFSKIIEFKEKYKLGNIFILFGLIISISGIILQYYEH